MDSQNRVKPAFDDLLDDFYHPNPKVNEGASVKMIQYWPEKATSFLLDGLSHEDLTFRRKCVKALGQLGEKVLPQIVHLFYSSENEYLRISCLKTFVQVVRHLNGKPL